MFTDNVHFDLRLEPEYLKDALKLALTASGYKNVTHYAVDPNYGMILFWAFDENSKFELIPAPPINIVDFVNCWLNEQSPKDYNSEDEWDQQYPDGEVWSELGFRMYCEEWGHVADSPYAFMSIKPVYIWYGK